MRAKIVLGIILPLLIIAGFIILSNSKQGLSITKETVQKLTADEVSPDKRFLHAVVQKITIQNDFFIPRKIILPKLTGCLKEKGTEMYAQLPIEYSPSKGLSGSLLTDAINFLQYNDQGSAFEMDVSPYSTLHVEAFIKPMEYYQHQSSTENKTYETLTLIEEKPLKEVQYFYQYPDCYALIKDETLTKTTIVLEHK